MLKVAIITGASRGIGKEIAKKFAREGIIVVANYNKSEGKAKELRQELQAEGIEIDIFKADVTKKNEIKQMVDYVLGKIQGEDAQLHQASIEKAKEAAVYSIDHTFNETMNRFNKKDHLK